jgi:hypothetical protein
MHSPTSLECVNRLVKQVPELLSLYDEHIRDNKEILPHVYFGDVTRYVVQQIRSGQTGPATPVERILNYLEECIASGDEDVKELVVASFIENLMGEDDVVTCIKGQIGPYLKKEFKDFGKHTGLNYYY